MAVYDKNHTGPVKVHIPQPPGQLAVLGRLRGKGQQEGARREEEE